MCKCRLGLSFSLNDPLILLHFFGFLQIGVGVSLRLICPLFDQRTKKARLAGSKTAAR